MVSHCFVSTQNSATQTIEFQSSATQPGEFFKAKNALLEAFPGLEFEVQEIVFLPRDTKTLSAEDQATFEKFLGMVNESDDVQEIYHNVAMP